MARFAIPTEKNKSDYEKELYTISSDGSEFCSFAAMQFLWYSSTLKKYSYICSCTEPLRETAV